MFIWVAETTAKNEFLLCLLAKRLIFHIIYLRYLFGYGKIKKGKRVLK